MNSRSSGRWVAIARVGAAVALLAFFSIGFIAWPGALLNSRNDPSVLRPDVSLDHVYTYVWYFPVYIFTLMSALVLIPRNIALRRASRSTDIVRLLAVLALMCTGAFELWKGMTNNYIGSQHVYAIVWHGARMASLMFAALVIEKATSIQKQPKKAVEVNGPISESRPNQAL